MPWSAQFCLLKLRRWAWCEAWAAVLQRTCFWKSLQLSRCTLELLGGVHCRSFHACSVDSFQETQSNWQLALALSCSYWYNFSLAVQHITYWLSKKDSTACSCWQIWRCRGREFQRSWDGTQYRSQSLRSSLWWMRSTRHTLNPLSFTHPSALGALASSHPPHYSLKNSYRQVFTCRATARSLPWHAIANTIALKGWSWWQNCALLWTSSSQRS